MADYQFTAGLDTQQHDRALQKITNEATTAAGRYGNAWRGTAEGVARAYIGIGLLQKSIKESIGLAREYEERFGGMATTSDRTRKAVDDLRMSIGRDLALGAGQADGALASVINRTNELRVGIVNFIADTAKSVATFSNQYGSSADIDATLDHEQEMKKSLELQRLAAAEEVNLRAQIARASGNTLEASIAGERARSRATAERLAGMGLEQAEYQKLMDLEHRRLEIAEHSLRVQDQQQRASNASRGESEFSSLAAQIATERNELYVSAVTEEDDRHKANLERIASMDLEVAKQRELVRMEQLRSRMARERIESEEDLRREDANRERDDDRRRRASFDAVREEAAARLSALGFDVAGDDQGRRYGPTALDAGRDMALDRSATMLEQMDAEIERNQRAALPFGGGRSAIDDEIKRIEDRFRQARIGVLGDSSGALTGGEQEQLLREIERRRVETIDSARARDLSESQRDVTSRVFTSGVSSSAFAQREIAASARFGLVGGGASTEENARRTAEAQRKQQITETAQARQVLERIERNTNRPAVAIAG